MISSAALKTSTVAIGHGQTTDRSWPLGWEQVGDQLRERLKMRRGGSRTAYCVSGDARRIAWDLGTPPEAVTPEDWAKSQTRWLGDRKRYRVALSYLSLHLASQGLWPKEFIPAWTSTDLILDGIDPEWQSIIRRLMEEWTRTGVTYQIRMRWRRALACFLWQSDLPTSGTLDLPFLTRQWDKFLNNPPACLESAAAIQNHKGLRRAMLGMVNMFITDGRLGGEKSPYAAVQTPFWLPISEDVRAAAHRVLPGSPHVNKNDLRGPFARYVLMHCLGFCSARPRKDSTVNEREWGEVRDRLTAEHFSPQAVEAAIVDTRQIVELATKMKEVVS